jgi:hypothetical protein
MPRTRSSWIAALALPALLGVWSLPASSAPQSADGAWSALDAGALAPHKRREYAAVYDVLNQRYVIFAGRYGDDGYTLVNEVWALALTATPAWTPLNVAGSPPGDRHSPHWGYDPARNRMLIFGGYGRHHPGDEYAYLNDVWELSLGGTPTWTELLPSGTPPTGRLAGVSAYDLLRQRFVGFGGVVGLPVDTWVLDLSGEPEWSMVETDGDSPPGGYGMTSIYDPVRDRMVVFGGSTSEDYYGTHNDTWELSLRPARPRWRKLDPQGPLPLARRSLTSIFDPLRYRMIVFGGWDGNPDTDAFLNDTWALSLSPLVSMQWTELSPEGVIPTVRDAMTAAYDPLGDRMVVYGGWSGLDYLGDTQFLSWGGVGRPASVTASSEEVPGAARVHWKVQDATGPLSAVYRRDAVTPWTSIATVESDASGAVSFEDHSVTPGGRYGYLITVPSERGQAFAGETWVDVAGAVGVEPGTTIALSLDRVRPNPVVDRLVASFTLPGSEPARFEVLDLAGRRIFSREVGGLGPGWHQLEIGTAGDFTAGLYFLRLTQSGQSRATRVVVGGAGR